MAKNYFPILKCHSLIVCFYIFDSSMIHFNILKKRKEKISYI